MEEQAGLRIPLTDDGEPQVGEIDPLLADLEAGAFAGRACRGPLPGLTARALDLGEACAQIDQETLWSSSAVAVFTCAPRA